jgi:hypothetical protein
LVFSKQGISLITAKYARNTQSLYFGIKANNATLKVHLPQGYKKLRLGGQ